VRAGDNETEVGVDVGVERLLRLLWLFRRQSQTRTSNEIEDCGYNDLHAEGSVGRKNFFNDRERLKLLGIALEPTNNQTAWHVQGSLDDVTLVLTPQERDALTEARLLVAEDHSDTDGTESVVKNRKASQNVPETVPTILAAISDKRPLRFVYGQTTRFVDPYRVAVTPTDRWYLLGIDRNIACETSTRTFRIDRITELTTNRDSTVPPCPTDATWPLHPVAWGTADPIVATIRFPHEPLPEWLAMLGQTHSTPQHTNPAPLFKTPRTNTEEATTELSKTASTMNDDGTVELEFAVTNREAFVRRTLAIGATIEGPPALVELARSTLNAHLHAYGSR
jgi:WYL domain